MMTHILALVIFAFMATGTLAHADGTSVPYFLASSRELASRSFSLERRYADAWVNEVFADNILLTLARMDGSVSGTSDISWSTIKKPKTYSFALKPGEVFAFHEDVLDHYRGKVVKTTNSHFNAADGFRFSGLYFGDGVCHLASLLYWTAKSAGLAAEAPANHDFAPIPEVPKEYGVSIYFMPGSTGANSQQNLYITNSLAVPVRFLFVYNGQYLTIRVVQENNLTN